MEASTLSNGVLPKVNCCLLIESNKALLDFSHESSPFLLFFFEGTVS